VAGTDLIVDDRVYIPAEALQMRAVRSSGPGGQNVNKVASKIELRVELGLIRGMDAGARDRLLRMVGKRLDSDGRLLVTSQRTRDQRLNLEDAREKVRTWIARALNPPRKRIASRPGRQARERRLAGKRRQALRKQERRRPGSSDD
jgi:ribosome-associated protein